MLKTGSCFTLPHCAVRKGPGKRLRWLTLQKLGKVSFEVLKPVKCFPGKHEARVQIIRSHTGLYGCSSLPPSPARNGRRRAMEAGILSKSWLTSLVKSISSGFRARPSFPYKAESDGGRHAGPHIPRTGACPAHIQACPHRQTHTRPPHPDLYKRSSQT